MTDLTEAARATRKYLPGLYNSWNPLCIFDTISRKEIGEFSCSKDAQAACDLKNLEEVLKQLREPSEGMRAAAIKAGYNWLGYGDLDEIWRAMIDALIAEVREAGNDA